jgi:asparagine synthase (glutamine-hydrolysing)
MCGLAGIFAYHYAALPTDRAELRTIRDHMATRGPDGQGEWFSRDGRVALGHRRLAIIDLTDAGTQPMCSADGQLVVSFNGEIYNHRHLRRELETKGRQFRTDSDTEVLLHLYDEKGIDMLADLRGMFAFALWDARKHAMLLARDPYGIKPLYFADDGWTLRLASQVKAVLASPEVSRTPEPAGLAGFYLLGSVPEPYTLYQEIRSVPAGSYQWVDESGPHSPKQYFSVATIWANASQEAPVGRDELQHIVRTALLDSVRHHLVADVPVGAFLSAGIDSGALVGLMRDVGQQDIETVTLGFDEFRDTPQDETPLARKVAQHYGVHHCTHLVTEADFTRDLPHILAAMDQPSIDGINTWFVSKAAHEAGLKVAISGLGGDELFGGYPSFRDIPRWMRLMWLPSRIPGLGAMVEQVQAAFAPLFPSINPKAAGIVRYGGTCAGAYQLRRGLFLPHELADLMGADQAREGLRRLQPLRHISSVLNPLPGSSYGQVATLEATLYMRNQLLRDADWASMAHSLEVRTPLVDANLLCELAGSLVGSQTSGLKALLANSPTNPLPDEVTRRAKTGFSTPITTWQQRGDAGNHWRKRTALAAEHCPWARRWAFSVAMQETVAV